MQSRIREEEGMGLVELLVAMVVMSIGILALVAGFSSGFGSINRASKTSIAGALADQQMEAFRRGAYSSVASIAGATKTGTDGRTYWIVSDVVSKCPDEATPSGSPAMCTLSGGTVSKPVKRVTVVVRDGSSTAPVLITQSSTFDASIS